MGILLLGFMQRLFCRWNYLEVTTDLEFDNTLGTVHTRGESLQDGLRDVWTCETILASAYILYCLSTI